MAEMWGIAGGFRNFAQDEMELAKIAQGKQAQQDLARHRLEMEQQGRLGLTLEAGRLGLQQAKAADEVETEKALRDSAEGIDTSTPAGQIAAFRAGANKLLALGKVDDAAKLANTAAQTLVRLENAANAESQQRTRDYELAEKKTRRMQELLVNVRSQTDLDRARLTMMNDETLAAEAMHPALQTYDAKAVGALLSGSPALLEKMKLDRQRADDASKKALRDARISYMDFRRGIDERQVKNAEDREARLEKAGAAAAGGGGGGGAAPAAAKPPTNTMRTDVLTALKAKGLASNDAGMRNLQITSLAEDAITLAQNNRGIRSFGEAIELAIAGAQQRGELTAAEGLLGKPYGMFKQQPGSPARPINVKQGDKIDYKEGNHYRDPKGTVVRFEGGKFVPVFSGNPKERVQPTTPVVPNNPLLDDEEDEE